MNNAELCQAVLHPLLARAVCRFPRQPITTMRFPAGADPEILIGESTPPIPLRDAGSVGTGLPGHVYEAVLNGQLRSYVTNAERNSNIARLTIWPTAEWQAVSNPSTG